MSESDILEAPHINLSKTESDVAAQIDLSNPAFDERWRREYVAFIRLLPELSARGSFHRRGISSCLHRRHGFGAHQIAGVIDAGDNALAGDVGILGEEFVNGSSPADAFEDQFHGDARALDDRVFAGILASRRRRSG